MAWAIVFSASAADMRRAVAVAWLLAALAAADAALVAALIADRHFFDRIYCAVLAAGSVARTGGISLGYPACAVAPGTDFMIATEGGMDAVIAVRAVTFAGLADGAGAIASGAGRFLDPLDRDVVGHGHSPLRL